MIWTILSESDKIFVALCLQVARNYSNDTQTKRCAAANTSSSSDAELAPYCYDAIWAVALALNKTILGSPCLQLLIQIASCSALVYSTYKLSIEDTLCEIAGPFFKHLYVYHIAI